MAAIRLQPADDPSASIIVLAFRQAERLRACLESLAGLRTAIPHEVIVVLNGATPEVAAVLDDVDGAVVERSRVNLGFAGGCNRGVARARGHHLVLLNDDTCVAPDWLDRLVGAADADRKVGVVGSLVLFEDGRVQDAGGRVLPDGTPTVIGRGLSATSPEITETREVDYASGCATLVKREAWDAVGGLDEGYFPAYFEDVDLCLRVRRAGWQVETEHRAVVHHAESSSTDDVVKAVAWERNKARFLARWGPAVEESARDDVGWPSERPAATEIEFLEQAASLHEAIRARLESELYDARSRADGLRRDLDGALNAVGREREHGAWLEQRLEATRAEVEALTTEVDAWRNRRSVRWLDRLSEPLAHRPRLERWLRGAWRAVPARKSRT